MIELQLLGLQPDGENLTLNDVNGNRYSLPVNDALRAALRQDIDASQSHETPARQMSPREIQALIRQGRSVQEVCELSALPASRIGTLAHPILAEREYTARTARMFPMGREIGALTVEEVVASRLLSRGVRPTEIRWDATREQGRAWQLVAYFTSADRDRKATWTIDLDRRALEAVDDEATWLSETQLARASTPWRHPNTPPVPEQAPDPSSGSSEEPETAPQANRIEEVLASLDAQRGKQRPMPTFVEADEEAPEPEFAGAHPATSEPTAVQDATILSLPQRRDPDAAPGDAGDLDVPAQRPSDSSATLLSISSKKAVRGVEDEDAQLHKKKRGAARPTMPSWDEIVFGKKDE